MDKIRTFTDLDTWKISHQLVLIIYQISTGFPNEEIFCLTNQMRRAAISITSNIAEGFSRQTKKEKLQFYYIAKGSLTELQNKLVLSRDLGYIDKSRFKEVAELTVKVHKLINGLIKSSRNKE